MSLVLVVAASVLMVLPGGAAKLMRQLRPSESAKVQLVVLTTGMASLGLGLALCATPVVFGVLGLEPIGPIGSKHFFPGGPVAGWVSLAVLFGLLGAAVAAITRHWITEQRLRAATAYASQLIVEETPVWVLPTESPIAVALPLDGGSVVISEGALEQLDANQLRAVVRHELSHLSHNHQRYLLVADLVERVFGAIPAISASTRSMRLSVEQWADDDSILRPSDRGVIISAMSRIAGVPVGPTIAAFAAEDQFANRLSHLRADTTDPSLTSRLLVYGATIIGLIGAIGSLLLWLV